MVPLVRRRRWRRRGRGLGRRGHHLQLCRGVALCAATRVVHEEGGAPPQVLPARGGATTREQIPENASRGPAPEDGSPPASPPARPSSYRRWPARAARRAARSRAPARAARSRARGGLRGGLVVAEGEAPPGTCCGFGPIRVTASWPGCGPGTAPRGGLDERKGQRALSSVRSEQLQCRLAPTARVTAAPRAHTRDAYRRSGVGGEVASSGGHEGASERADGVRAGHAVREARAPPWPTRAHAAGCEAVLDLDHQLQPLGLRHFADLLPARRLGKGARPPAAAAAVTAGPTRCCPSQLCCCRQSRTSGPALVRQPAGGCVSEEECGYPTRHRLVTQQPWAESRDQRAVEGSPSMSTLLKHREHPAERHAPCWQERSRAVGSGASSSGPSTGFCVAAVAAPVGCRGTAPTYNICWPASGCAVSVHPKQYDDDLTCYLRTCTHYRFTPLLPFAGSSSVLRGGPDSSGA